jgi:hypothetical protein
MKMEYVRQPQKAIHYERNGLIESNRKKLNNLSEDFYNNAFLWERRIQTVSFTQVKDE